MRALVIGGERQGQWVTIPVLLGRDPRTWVDLTTATTYMVRKISWAVEGPIKGSAAELWKLPIVVHPTMVGPMEGELAQMALFQVIGMTYMTEFMQQHAVAQELPPPQVQVPDTAAELDEEAP